jgi:uncharacterized RDD family membrane protein YckC
MSDIQPAEPASPDAGPPPVANAGLLAARRLQPGGTLLRRWAGAWIDFIVLAALFLVPVAALGEARATAGVVISLGLMLIYFPITEGIWGRSLGKLITGMIVVDASGNPPGPVRAIVRTLLRLVEVNPFLAGGLPAGICVFATKHQQRLGDLAAGTYVVPLSDLRAARRGVQGIAVFES